MSLWGKTDNLAGTPKFVTRVAYFAATGVDTTADTINILESNTGFATGDAVVYGINGGTVIGGLTDGTTYYVRSAAAGLIELYDSYANAIAAPATTGRVDITGAGVGVHTLRRTGAANPFGDSTYNGQALLFVDREESKVAANRAKGLVSPGWWAYRTYTDGGGATRHKAELLVAMDVVHADSGDASDDAVVPDLILTITTQPDSATVVVDEDATLSVVVSSNAEVVTYQWQVSTDSGDTWNDLSGEFGSTLVIEEAQADLDGNQYRVVATAATIVVTSDAATLTVEDLTLTITVQPTDETAVAGDDALFTVEATTNGNQPITYQWQVSTDDGVTWEDVDRGATQDSLTVSEVTAEHDGIQYRVVATVAAVTVTSTAATLTVTE